MAKKKDEKDVLIVRDEKTGEISVVAGLQADGTPRRTPPKMENAQDFLQFDKNGDVLDNFFRNFFNRQRTNILYILVIFKTSIAKRFMPLYFPFVLAASYFHPRICCNHMVG